MNSIIIEVNPSRVGGTHVDVLDWSRENKAELERAIELAVRIIGFEGDVVVKVGY